MFESGWLYAGFTVLLVCILAGIMIYHFQAKRKYRMEEPKYRMLDDD
jgi:hypothetical protein